MKKVYHTKQANLNLNYFLNYFLINSGLFIILCLFSHKVLAENFRDQQDRMREEYYQEQEWQRAIESNEDYQDIHQNQYEQNLNTQKQLFEMNQEKTKMQQTMHEVKIKQNEQNRQRLIEQKAIEKRQKNMTATELEAQKLEAAKNRENPPVDVIKEKKLKNQLQLN